MLGHAGVLQAPSQADAALLRPSGTPVGAPGRGAPDHKVARLRPSQVHSGRPLDTGVRADMETRFGADFSDVRIHTGAQAARSATAVAAKAYTAGNDIVFGRAAFAPHNAEGKHTLAHELTHVLQQRGGLVSGRSMGGGVTVSDPSDAFEHDAEVTAGLVLAGPGLRPSQIGPARYGNGAAGLRIQRQPLSAVNPAPSTLTCPVSTAPPPEAGTAVIFATEGASVDSELQKVINGFLDIWDNIRTTKRAGVGDPIEVHGYASTTGPTAVNWDLSCRRAEAVRTALQARMTARGWPLPRVDVLAHGPTNVFDPAPLRNQRVVISATRPDDYRGIVSRPPAGTFPGLGARKSALRSNGGNLLDMAVAMLETETMDAHEYPDRDNKPPGDAACFGIFKQNWGLIRTSGAMPALSGPPLPGQLRPGLAEADWPRGRQLNDDLTLDVAVLHGSQAQLGLNKWFAGHRWGSTGLTAFDAAARGSTTAAQRGVLSDIADYQGAVEWIRDQLVHDPALQADDRKVFVRVPAV
jgi:outer membrane protein OmpA-like peptidoglycan-associated protein